MFILLKEPQLTADERPPDEDLTDAWIARTVQPALAYAISLVRNRHDAEDVVQECYRKLLSRTSQYDLSRDGEKLLYRSVTNACINLVQRRPATTQLDDTVFPPVAAEGLRPDSRLMRQELEQTIEQALAKLPVNQRAILELSSLGHSLVEVAEMVNLSHANVRVLLHRARQSVAERLKVYEQGKCSE